jgi:hypothetical protein
VKRSAKGSTLVRDDPTPKASPWRSRIIGSGEEDPTQLLANPMNWRTHPNRQREAMRGALQEVGWVQQVVVNQTTGHVVDGHLRVEEAISAGAPAIPVLYVELTPEEERVVLATLDPLGAMAGKSDERLTELLGDLSVDNAALLRMLEGMARDPRDMYIGVVRSPRYVPVGERPDAPSLYDEGKTKALRADVLANRDIDDATRDFLLAAASRHTVFDYGKIAEAYAHASPDVQRLMEASALVIIDFEDAIQQGYVKFTETIAALVEEDEDA